MTQRMGESHVGNGSVSRGIQHIRGLGVANTPGLLSWDAVNDSGTREQQYGWGDDHRLWHNHNVLPTDQDKDGGVYVPQTDVIEDKNDNYTVDEQDSGKVIRVTVDAKVVTLPATIAGLTVIIMNGGADAAVEVTVRPNAVDKIMGVDITSADDKDLVNTKATAKKGDFLRLVGDGANGWFVQGKRGTWAREA